MYVISFSVTYFGGWIYECYSGEGYTAIENFCDGKNDCNDKSDESFCDGKN